MLLIFLEVITIKIDTIITVFYNFLIPPIEQVTVGIPYDLASKATNDKDPVGLVINKISIFS